MSKRGRPRVDNPKEKRFSIRLDEETEDELKCYCEKQGITKGAAIRQAIDLFLKTNQTEV